MISLAESNHYLNTIVPYGKEFYHKHPTVRIAKNHVRPIHYEFGVNSNTDCIKWLWDARKVAVINGISYANLQPV